MKLKWIVIAVIVIILIIIGIKLGLKLTTMNFDGAPKSMIGITATLAAAQSSTFALA